MLLCLKDLLTGNCLVPFYPKQEVPATVQRTGSLVIYKEPSPAKWNLRIIFVGGLLSRKAGGAGLQGCLRVGSGKGGDDGYCLWAPGTQQATVSLSANTHRTLGRHRKV